MKKTLLTLLIVGVVSLVALSPAAAQSTAASVNVPFQFIVAGKVMPAGTYEISAQNSDWSVVMIRSIAPHTLTVTHTVDTGGNAEVRGNQARVSFTNYDGHLFLQQIEVPGTHPRRLTVNKDEAQRVLAKLNLRPAESAAPAK